MYMYTYVYIYIYIYVCIYIYIYIYYRGVRELRVVDKIPMRRTPAGARHPDTQRRTSAQSAQSRLRSEGGMIRLETLIELKNVNSSFSS